MKKYRWWVILLSALGILLLSANIAILVTGNSYIYKALLYNYVNIDDLDLFYARTVNNGSPQPWHISGEYNKGKLPDTIRTELEKIETVAYLVIQNDSIQYEEYWDHYTEKSVSNSFSMAKS